MIDPFARHHRSEARSLLGRAITATAVMSLLGLGTGIDSVAHAAIVPTVSLATSADYAVLAGQTVTNIGSSTLDGSLGLSPGTDITGFPPGAVLPPWTTNTTNAAAALAESDLTAAYLDAAGRPLDATTTADLGGLTLAPGVYAGPSKSALSLTGPLVLDAGGDSTAVFIFQTDSSLITGSGSTVSLINGAQECNVFWQVASSATLGTGSVFTGNILALTSIAVNTGVVVHGRALARNGEVTLDSDVFTRPSCVNAVPSTTAPPTTAPPTTAPPTTAPPTTAPTGVTTAPGGFDVSSTVVVPATPVLTVPFVTLPRTGSGRTTTSVMVAAAMIAVGAVALRGTRRSARPRRHVG